MCDDVEQLIKKYLYLGYRLTFFQTAQWGEVTITCDCGFEVVGDLWKALASFEHKCNKCII